MIISQGAAMPVRPKCHKACSGALPTGVSEEKYILRPPYRALYARPLSPGLSALAARSVGGAALAPVAPEFVAEIVDQRLAPMLASREVFAAGVLWSALHNPNNLMRDRGHSGGFMLDAASACDGLCKELPMPPAAPRRAEKTGFPSFFSASSATAAVNGFLFLEEKLGVCQLWPNNDLRTG